MKTLSITTDNRLPRKLARLYKSRKVSSGGSLLSGDDGTPEMMTYTIAVRSEAKIISN